MELLLSYSAKKIITDIQSGKTKTNAELYKHYSNGFNKVISQIIDSGNYGSKNFDLQQRLIASTNRFAAAKAHKVTQLIDRQRIDNNGVERTSSEYRKAAAKVLHAFEQHQKTEQATAAARTRTAKQFAQFADKDRARIFPNLRWIPSRSANPRAEHATFYNRVWAKDDPFWATNSPGTEWNCKCDIEETDSQITDNSRVQGVEPMQGLKGNPYYTGQIFSDDAKYYHNLPATEITNINKKYNQHLAHIKEFAAVDDKTWRRDYFGYEGGYLVTDKSRIAKGDKNSREKEIFNKEHSMSLALAKNGYAVKYRRQIDGEFDVYVNDVPADLKKTKGNGHVVQYALKAVTKQGAEMVVFEFEVENKYIYEELQELKARKIKVLYYFTDRKDKIYTL